MGKAFNTILSLPEPNEERTDRQFITSLARGLEVLRAFETGDGLLGNLEIAQRTRLPRPTIARITHTLTMLGYLDYNRRLEKYSLGTPVLSLGFACLNNVGITRVARPYMQELADFANGSVALGSRDRLSLVYLELTHGNATVSLRLDVGARIPIHKSAMGMAYLHALPEAEREFLVDAIRRQYAKDFPEFKKRLSTAFEELDTVGFCVALATYERTVNGVGVPLKLLQTGSVFAFNCSGPSFQMTEDFMRNEAGPRLAAMVRNVSLAVLRQPIQI